MVARENGKRGDRGDLSISFISTALANDTRRCLAGGDGESVGVSPRHRRRLRMLALGDALGENGTTGGRASRSRNGVGGDDGGFMSALLLPPAPNCSWSTRTAETPQQVHLHVNAA